METTNEGTLEQLRLTRRPWKEKKLFLTPQTRATNMEIIMTRGWGMNWRLWASHTCKRLHMKWSHTATVLFRNKASILCLCFTRCIDKCCTVQIWIKFVFYLCQQNNSFAVWPDNMIYLCSDLLPCQIWRSQTSLDKNTSKTWCYTKIKEIVTRSEPIMRKQVTITTLQIMKKHW